MQHVEIGAAKPVQSRIEPMLKSVAYSLALFAILPSVTLAQTVPTLINYQGRLTDAAGAPLATADYSLTFRLYSVPTVGSTVWGPQIFDGTSGTGKGPKIPVVQGYFNVILGPVDTTGRSLLDAFRSGPRYLEVTVGTGAPIQPRQQILAAPYALTANIAASIADYKFSAQTADHNGWLLCDGRSVSQTTYASLFGVIGTNFGPGDGPMKFNLPDGEGRVFGAIGQGTGLTARALGNAAGEEKHTQSVSELPSHNHKQNTYGPRAAGGTANIFSSVDQNDGTIFTDSTGGGQAFNVMQPTLFIGNLFIYAGTP